MKYFLLFVSLVFVGCSTNPTGHQGYLGDGSSISFYHYTGTLADQYNDTVSAWELPIITDDSVFIDCKLRQDEQHVWFEPDTLYFDRWNIRIRDGGRRYAGYEYKVVLIQ